ncbi:MAG: hypothetical protein K1X81_13950 [Bacteroidia bacterium]|nr:hypothetical protein [Bacteroidia bacterium]
MRIKPKLTAYLVCFLFTVSVYAQTDTLFTDSTIEFNVTSNWYSFATSTLFVLRFYPRQTSSTLSFPSCIYKKKYFTFDTPI